MVSYRPFQFTGLTRLSKQQVAFYESLAVFLSYRPLKAEFATQVSEILQQGLRTSCKVSAPELQAVSRAQLRAVLPKVGCLAVLGAAPGSHKILADLDPSLAAFAVERLLGGSGEQSRVPRAFTDIETGVLSYLLLKVLTLLQSSWESGREVALTLERFGANLDALQDDADLAGGYQQLGVRINAGPRAGYLRLFIPDALITERFGAAPAQSGATPQELDYMRGRLRALGERTVVARMTVSSVDLQPKDVANVEPGDIIVLENHHLQITPDGIEGEVFVTLGFGKNGGFTARLRNDESEADQARLEVVQIVLQEQPLEESAMAAEEPEDNLPETEGLLRDIDASVVVELGRIRMNTAQVVRLRSGQILRLARGPNDPVDLVVNGKLYARGELIDVEGELGVRLTQVAGAD